MNDFREGLEGIVAFRTEIAEPDREGGSLRYRGVDIEDLVGHVPFEQVWGLLVDDSLTPGLAPAEPFALPAADGRPGGRPAGGDGPSERGLGPRQADRHLGRPGARRTSAGLSSTMISIVAQSARLHDGEKTPVDPAVVAAGATAAERFLLEWRGQADPRHVTAIDTYWICTAEHGMNASTFTARVVASTGADCAACLSSAVGALSGPLHGGAPARVLPMLDAAAEAGVGRRLRQGAARLGRASHGFRAPRLPGRGPSRADLAESSAGARFAAIRGRGRARAGGARGARAASPGAGARDERRVLVGRRARRRRRSRPP